MRFEWVDLVLCLHMYGCKHVCMHACTHEYKNVHTKTNIPWWKRRRMTRLQGTHVLTNIHVCVYACVECVRMYLDVKKETLASTLDLPLRSASSSARVLWSCQSACMYVCNTFTCMYIYVVETRKSGFRLLFSVICTHLRVCLLVPVSWEHYSTFLDHLAVPNPC